MKNLFFDIETGGFSGASSSILSISHAGDKGEVSSIYSNPTAGTTISRWSENKVWEPIKQRGYSTVGEKQALTDFLSVLGQAKEEGRQLVGWNIGQVAASQNQTSAGGFDIPMLISRADKFGMGEDYRKVIGGMKINDLGSTWAFKIARGVASEGQAMVDAGKMHESLFTEAVGYMKQAGKLAAEQGLTRDEDIGAALSRANVRFSGWKQEMVFEITQGKALAGAHESAEDVRALRTLMATDATIDEKFLSHWSSAALENKMVSSAKSVPPSIEAVPARYDKVMQEAEEWGVREGTERKLRTMAADSGVDFASVQSGKGIPTVTRRVAAEQAAETLSVAGKGRMAQALDLAIPFARQHWGKMALGAGAAALVALKPGNLFSGRDDEYNVIEGLPHGGLAQQMRREMTDFGSGSLRKTISAGALDILTDSGSIRGLSDKMFNWMDEAVKIDQASYGFVSGAKTMLKDIVSEKQILKKRGLWEEAQNVRAGIKQLQDEGFGRVTFVNPSLSGEILHETTRHESLHQFIPEYIAGDLRRLSKKVVKEENLKTPFLGGHLFEEAAAYSHETIGSTRKTYSGAVGAIQEKYPDLLDQVRLAALKNKVAYQEGTERISTNNRFSGFDDAYNTIEGLRHGGEAERMRKALTDFGSGWIRKALKRGMSTVDVAIGISAGGVGRSGMTEEVFTRHVGDLLKNDVDEAIRFVRKSQGVTVENQRWMYGKEFSKEGKMGTVWTGHRVTSSAKGVRGAQAGLIKQSKKTINPAKSETGTMISGPMGTRVSPGSSDPLEDLALRMQKMPGAKPNRTIVTGSFDDALKPITQEFDAARQQLKVAHMRGRGIPEAQKKLDIWQKKMQPYEDVINDYMREISGTMNKEGLSALQYEAKMMKAKKAEGGDMFVPEVFASDKDTLIQEFAGKSIKDLPDRYAKKLFDWQEKNVASQLGATSGVVHLDPHPGNILVRGANYGMIDYGLAVQAREGAAAAARKSLMAPAYMQSVNKNRLANNIPVLQPAANMPDMKMVGSAVSMSRQEVLKNFGEDAAKITREKVVSQLNPSILEAMNAKQVRKSKMQRAHNRGVPGASAYSLRPGKGHTQQTGGIVDTFGGGDDGTGW